MKDRKRCSNTLSITSLISHHAFSGKYDYEFMDYTIRVLRKCKQYGFKIYMDPHQDTVRGFPVFVKSLFNKVFG